MIRKSYYLVCCNCNNQFVDPQYGGSFCSPKEAKETAKKRGWKLNVKVENGSKWDFCPNCYTMHQATFRSSTGRATDF